MHFSPRLTALLEGGWMGGLGFSEMGNYVRNSVKQTK